MTMPNSKNNVTVRKLASALQGLLDKIKDAFLSKTSRGAANGVASLDANGKVPSSQLPSASDKRNFPKLNFYESGSNSGTSQYIKIATITCRNRYINYPFIFRCVTRDKFMYTIYFMPASSSTTKPGIKHFFVEIPVGDSSSTADVRFTYDDSGANRVYTLWFNPGVWNEVCTVLETVDGYDEYVDFTSEQYSTSLTNSISPQYIKFAWSTTPGSRVGNESTPIFMENTGTLKPCTNVPVIEHVTSIPVSPTVGTIYAL